MTGYGLTVIRGTEVQRFDVRILGILKGGPSSDLILFRATGPVIDQAGGSAEGMSGSPIYIGGRQIGALSYSYHFGGPDANLSLATPIEEMLRVLGTTGRTGETEDRLPPSVYEAATPIPTPLGPVSRVVLMRTTADAASYNAHRLPHVLGVAPAAVPVVTAGFSPRALALISRALARYNVVPMQGYAGYRDFTPPPMVPGSSIGVELVRGDVEVGAIGTLAYRRGNLVLAFGHPLINAGPLATPLTSAWIDTVVRSVDTPFKEGSLGPIVGTMLQDRGVGVGGMLGRFPRMFGVRVRVQDGDGGSPRTVTAQVVRRPDLAESLVPSVVLGAVQQALDRVSGGSASVQIKLRVRGLDQDVVREDLAYDVADIATASVLDVPSATQLLFGNFFQSLDPIDMTIDVKVRNEINTALLVSARPETRTVRTGQKVRVDIGLFPYGGAEEVSRSVEFSVPHDFPPGPAFLLVGTEGALNDSTSPAQKYQALTELQGSAPSGVGSLDEAVDQFERFGKNTDILFNLVPAPVLEAVGSNANPEFDAPAGAFLPTRWVVLGRFQIPVVVK